MFLLFFWKQQQHWIIWVSAFLAALGMLFLSTGGEIRFVSGDFLEFLGAILWALHVIVVGISVKNLDPIQFAIGQFFICAALNFVVGFVIEPQSIGTLSQLWQPVLYNGVVSVAIGFTLQGVGQKNAPATDAALILSMEAVFAAMFGFLFLHERFTPLQVTGCVLVLIAIILTQINGKELINFLSRKRDELS
jgi:drug/metabolite transporter (DMT)-like permease